MLATYLNLHVLESDEDSSLHSLGLYEAITYRYNASTLEPTHQRGQVLIDGIFISGSLLITSGACLRFRHVNSDHRALWIRIKISLAFGHMLYQITLF